jgi:nucleoside-diphosphate-sugar epimerase
MFPWSPKPKKDESFTTAATSTPTVTALPGFHSPIVDTTALVTGACGLCGARLIEMLFERGTKTIIAFDIAIPNTTLQERFTKIQQQTGGTIIECFGKEKGDITNDTAVQTAFTLVTPIHIVYHIAALVGPFFDRQLYYDVNYYGTKRIIQQCQQHHITQLIYSSSPGTRFTGADIEGLQEEDLPIPTKFLATYAETKALGEIEVTKACCYAMKNDDKDDKNDKDDNNAHALRTISIAPHQIYGPHDSLFLAKFLEVCGNDRLRIFGTGQYLISICYVDNYCHGLMCGADSIKKRDSTTLGKFYIITDGNEPRNLWQLINEASIAMGFTDLNTKFHLPVWFLYIIATIGNILGYIFNTKFKLNYFSLRMSTMHRYFNIDNAMKDLQYTPIVPFETAWPLTIQWFQQHWLPQFLKAKHQTQKNNKQPNKKDQ